MKDNNDYLGMVKIGDSLGKNRNNYPEVKLALLSDNAAQQFVLVLKAALISKKFYPVIYDGGYNSIPFELFNEESNLYSFNPEYVLLNISSQGYRERFYNTSIKEKPALPQKYADEIASYIKKITDKHHEVIVNSLAIPHERFFGNYSANTLHSIYGSILEVNRLIRQQVSETPGCHINDIAYLSAQIGIDHWYSEKIWTLSKYMCAPKFFPKVAENVANIFGAIKGNIAKCLVLDLDNILWGGIIGDDGINGIEIGGTGVGEAYRRFQSYLLELKNRGYLLAVCSKNEYKNAVQPFREHSNMTLKEEHFIAFVANWDIKSTNIKYIAKKLNIGCDSIIFIDDSPFERNQVKSMLPQVIAPEMPEDPSDFVPFLESTGLFETVTFSIDDQKRPARYKEQFLREKEKLKFETIDDYLQSLDMIIALKRFDKFHLARIVQLIQRSNQFNLTTKRYSEQTCKKFMEDEKNYPFYIKLKDIFGDYGLVSVVCTVNNKNTLKILEYVMSCRILNRGVEQFVMNHIVEYCKSMGILKIVGEYVPGNKNMMVREFYKQFGFELINETSEKLTWTLNVDDYKFKKTYFKEEL